MVFAYRKTGVMKRTLVIQAVNETVLEIKDERNLETGWHTAIYRSALMINRKILLVN